MRLKNSSIPKPSTKLFFYIIKGMYAKYGEDSQAGKGSSAEQDAICELVRQKNHLELCLTSVKRKLSKDTQFTRTEQLKTMHVSQKNIYKL